MNRSRILLGCLCVLALVALCGILVALPSVTLYEAKSDAYSSDQADPATKTLVTNDNAAMILPLMDELGVSFERLAQAAEEADPEYLQKMLTKFGNQVSTFKSLQNLPQSLMTSYNQAADTVTTAGTVFSNDYARVLSLITDLDLVDGDAEHMTLETLANATLKDTDHNRAILVELGALGMEMQVSLTHLQNASVQMASVAETFGRSTAELNTTADQLSALVDRVGILLDGGALWQNVSSVPLIYTILPQSYTISSQSSYTISSQSSYTISPQSGIYGQTVTFIGTTTASEPVTAYIDGTVWGTGKSNTMGVFTLKTSVGRVPAGIHTVTMSSSQGFGKSVEFTVIPAEPVLTITSLSQGVADTGGLLLNVSGTLRMETGVAVVNASVDVVEVSGTYLGTGMTGSTGLWEVSAPVNPGTYELYARFMDTSFPLNATVSEPETITVGKSGFSYYYVILLVVLAAGGVLVWQILRRRTHGRTEQVVQEPEAEPVMLQSVAVRAVQEEDEDVFAGIEPDILRPVLPYPAGIDEASDIREVYRCVIHAVLRSYEGNVDALTPYEAAKEAGIPALEPFVERYVYLRYGVSSDADGSELKRMAHQLEGLL